MPTFDTCCFRHNIARQQHDRSRGQRRAHALADRLKLCLRRCAEIVDVRQLAPVPKDRIDAARFGDLLTAPPADRELTQVPAAFKPNGAQIAIDIFQCGRAANFEIQPEIAGIGVLRPQVVQCFGLAVGLRGAADLGLALMPRRSRRQGPPKVRKIF